MKHILLISILTVLSITSTSAVTTATNKKERSIWSFFRFNRSETNTNEQKYVITRYGNGGIDIKCPVIQTEDGNYTIHGTYTEYYRMSNIVSRTIEYTNGVCHGRQIE